MKTAFIFLFSGFLFLLLLKLILKIVVRSSTIDIHFYDTYFIIDTKTLLLVMGLFLAGLFFIGLAIGAGRKVK
ncbi:MAG TPA: hypothetical protein VK498_06500 [Ferruginibacter sp.]|nr:hypothetical protein [Ferruginibacter sp.]